ncbi:MAG: hypothetical protein HND48_18905 [Chloroflexi bacterium]|nr:hypothetical protein [Chloroflexota bacterium]
MMVPAAALIGIGAWWAVQSRRGALIWAAGISLLLVYQHIKPFDDGYPPVWWPLTAVLAVAGIAACAHAPDRVDRRLRRGRNRDHAVRLFPA